MIPVTWTYWPKFCFQERHPGDSKNYNECIRHETIRVAVCDMLEGKCPCPEPLRYGKEAGREHKKVGVGKQVKVLWLPFLRTATGKSKSLTHPGAVKSGFVSFEMGGCICVVPRSCTLTKAVILCTLAASSDFFEDKCAFF